MDDTLRLVPRKGVQGKIWFSGCLMEDCMLKTVQILLTTGEGNSLFTMRRTTVLPGLEPFPVDGLLMSKALIDLGAKPAVQVLYGRRLIYRKEFEAYGECVSCERKPGVKKTLFQLTAWCKY